MQKRNGLWNEFFMEKRRKVRDLNLKKKKYDEFEERSYWNEEVDNFTREDRAICHRSKL